jgi:hypothetical protein
MRYAIYEGIVKTKIGLLEGDSCCSLVSVRNAEQDEHLPEVDSQFASKDSSAYGLCFEMLL